MPYRIPTLVHRRAARLGLRIAPSWRRGKKLAVLTPTGYTVHVGATGYVDYPTLLEKDKTAAREARRRFKTRFATALHRAPKYSPMWLADRLLW